MRFVFDGSAKVVQLGNAGVPGRSSGTAGWRAVPRAVMSGAFLLFDLSHNLAGDLATLLAPSDCHLCGNALASLRAAPVCEDCIVGIERMPEGALCTSCGDLLAASSVRMAGGWGDGHCSSCRMAMPEFERAVAFAPYSGANRDLLHLLKFDGLEPIAREILARGMADAILRLQGLAAAELTVIPVPLYRARERRRGFNQSLLLAEGALELLRRERPQWKLALDAAALDRVRDTHELYPLSPDLRRDGLRGAFKVRDAASVRGREVLLIDDILTTGATARECARTLRRAGAAKVWVATWARTIEPDEVAWWGAPPVRQSGEGDPPPN